MRPRRLFVALVAVLSLAAPLAACGRDGLGDVATWEFVLDDSTLDTIVPSEADNDRQPTGPPATDAADGPGWERRQGQAALALVRYPWRRLGWSIAFNPEVGDVIALAYPKRRHIDVFVRRGLPLLDLAHVIAHELGHAYDENHNDNRVRNAWKAARGFPEQPGWLNQTGHRDFGLPGGDFAEVFAYWAIGGRGMFRSELAPVPRRDELDRLAAQFFRAR